MKVRLGTWTLYILSRNMGIKGDEVVPVRSWTLLALWNDGTDAYIATEEGYFLDLDLVAGARAFWGHFPARSHI